MPRQARMKSTTGIYHIMIRGINKEKIFSKSAYKNKMLEIIREIRENLEFYIIGYCIMDNHLHLLIKVDEDKLDILMKKMNIKYAMYYNKTEKRYGHVFQDRFRSEAVEDDNYLLGALVYIHMNPVKAGMIKEIIEYEWSSAREYINQDSNIVTYKYLNEILGLFKSKEEFIRTHKQDDCNLYIDTKEEETEYIQNIINCTIEKFVNENKIMHQSMVIEDKKEELAEILLKLDIISYRDIAGLCNLSFYKVTDIAKSIKSKS